MDIGNPVREITVVPLSNPVQAPEPVLPPPPLPPERAPTEPTVVPSREKEDA